MKYQCKSKKGQQLNINSLGTIAIGLMIAVIVLGLGSTILNKIQGTQADYSATILNNESWTWPGNNTLQPFVESRVQTSSVVVYANESKLTLNTNYTVDSSGVYILNQTPGASVDMWDNLIYNMTYSYNYGSEAYNSSNYGMTGLVTMAEFVPTIAIVAVAAIVIGIILVFFGRRKEDM